MREGVDVLMTHLLGNLLGNPDEAKGPVLS